MQRRRTPACALTIAGSDSGGGAGIQADLKTFAALGVHGTSVLTCVTAQNPVEVRAVQAMRPDMVRAQIEAVWAELPPAAVKTGMLYSSSIIRTVAAVLRDHAPLALVVDPVMIATSGARLLQHAANAVLCRELLPLASVVTPNLDEVRWLTGLEVREPEDMRTAARELHERFGCAALIKGGHLPGPEAVDLFWDGHDEWLLSSPRVKGMTGHGTGCTYAAAIAGHLACGRRLADAVVAAKEYITAAIGSSERVGRHPVLGPWRRSGGG